MNPFYHGNPVTSANFFGRKKELRRLVQRIHSQQSSAIVGEPRSGKTSVLLHLVAEKSQPHFFGEEVDKCFIIFLDCQTFGAQTDQEQFWIQALLPVVEKLIEPQSSSKLAMLYMKTLEQGFNSYILGQLLDQLNNEGYQLILLMDEFDALLNHPQLNCAEFFGSLRSLASTKPALCLVIAARQPVTKLNKISQTLNNTGSPYFNFFEELTLNAFSSKDVGALLGRAGERFSNRDIEFIIRTAGAHPYLLQAVASELWNIYEDGDINCPKERLSLAGEKLYDHAARTLCNTWACWSPEMCMAMTVIALAETPKLVPQHEFHNEALLCDLHNFRPELRMLEKQGYIKKSTSNLSGWRIYPKAFEWWLTDELLRTTRDEKSFSQWIQEQEWDGLLTKGEKQQLIKLIKKLSEPLKNGITELIKIAIK